MALGPALVSLCRALPLGVVLSLSSMAVAADESEARWRALCNGEIVREPQVIDHGERRFVGGVSYALHEASLSEIEALTDDVAQYTSFLPFTRRARLIGENDGDRFVELVSGNSLINVKYTLRFRRTEPGTLRFWLDPTKPHDVPDAWGYLRWREVDTAHGRRLLLTMGVLAELPDGLTRALFQSRVQGALLSVLPKLAGELEDFRLARQGRP